MFIIIVFRLCCDRLSWLQFFHAPIASFYTFHTHVSLLTLFVCFFIFILLFPCANAWENTHAWSILNGTFFFREAKLSLLLPMLCLSKSNHRSTTILYLDVVDRPLFLLLSFSRDQSRDVTHFLGEFGWFFILIVHVHFVFC